MSLEKDVGNASPLVNRLPLFLLFTSALRPPPFCLVDLTQVTKIAIIWFVSSKSG